MDTHFETHVNAHYKNLYYFALSLTKNEADAADYTQQSYLKLAKKWHTIRDQTKVKSWLFSTLYREFLDRRKRNKFKSDISFEVATETIADESERTSTIDRETILTALMDLEDPLRLPLTLYYLEDYTYKQIAEILLIPIGTVMSRIHRGKRVLYQELTESSVKSQLAAS
ncbi:MAG: RNA polymerase sigma factor [Opitutaceae bacterium]